ncbi:hypothetical protein EDB86DRAFT_3219195 [Lactarius hatsudake]|nr:hypothetical protein EDB86DRAFT_3219195 [Lactarius hatsudake]
MPSVAFVIGFALTLLIRDNVLPCRSPPRAAHRVRPRSPLEGYLGTENSFGGASVVHLPDYFGYIFKFISQREIYSRLFWVHFYHFYCLINAVESPPLCPPVHNHFCIFLYTIGAGCVTARAREEVMWTLSGQDVAASPASILCLVLRLPIRPYHLASVLCPACLNRFYATHLMSQRWACTFPLLFAARSNRRHRDGHSVMVHYPSIGTSLALADFPPSHASGCGKVLSGHVTPFLAPAATIPLIEPLLYLRRHSTSSHVRSARDFHLHAVPFHEALSVMCDVMGMPVSSSDTWLAPVHVLIMELDWPATLVCMPLSCPSMRCSVACDVMGPIL